MKWLCLITLLFFKPLEYRGAQRSNPVIQGEDISINVWYGEMQEFGQLGRSQRWLNILGNISGSNQVKDVFYILNDRVSDSLALGCDLHRLAMPGDFNVELSWDEVVEGLNRLRIVVTTYEDLKFVKSVQFKVHKCKKWEIPYQVNFAEVKNLQDVVQIVDGHWRLVEDGVRTQQKYYDRVLTMGDSTWKNYEALVSLTIHDWTPSEPGPPTYNVSHFGVAMRWRGHHQDGRQPSRKWFPLGAQGEFLLKEHRDSSHWRILFDGRTREKPVKYARRVNRFKKGDKVKIRTQVQTISDGRSRYRFKQWLAEELEPEQWDVEGFEIGDYASGALCLVPHNSDVTIHSVQILSLPNGID